MIRVWIAGAAAAQMCFERIGDTFTAETGAVTMVATRRRGRGRSVCLEGPRATFRGLAAYAGYTTSGSFSSDCRGHGGTMRRAAAICMAAATGDDAKGWRAHVICCACCRKPRRCNHCGVLKAGHLHPGAWCTNGRCGDCCSRHCIHASGIASAKQIAEHTPQACSGGDACEHTDG